MRSKAHCYEVVEKTLPSAELPNVNAVAYFMLDDVLASAVRCSSFFGGWEQGKQRDFRRTIEADRNIDGSSPAYMYRASGPLDTVPRHISSPGQEGKRWHSGNLDLASMRVTGELQVDGKSCDFIGKIRLGARELRLPRGHATQCFVQICGSAEHVIHTGKPNARAIPLDGFRLFARTRMFSARAHESPAGGRCAHLVPQNGPEAIVFLHLTQAGEHMAPLRGCSAFISLSLETKSL